MPDYEIVDPRPVAASARYTYFLPPAERVAAVGVGDLVQVTVRAVPPSKKWDAERIWIKVLAADSEWLEGTLDSLADDMPPLPLGTIMRIPRTHVINVDFDDPAKDKAFPSSNREFWERCVVDQAVLDGSLLVHFVYREAPELTQETDRFPDSGWRIRADMRGVTEEDLAKREFEYVALGAVLNAEDSWIHLIDAPIGSAFIRNFETGEYEPSAD